MQHIFKRVIVRLLTAEARLVLARTKPTVIAVTGSVGKTSVKDAIYEVLKDHIHTRKSEASYNSEIGVPLSILGLPNAWSSPVLWVKNLVDGLFTALFPGNYPKVLVLETGIDHPGDMQQLTTWLKPDIAVVTRLPDVPVHVEFFASPEAVVREKMHLLEALKPDGLVVYNHDDPIIVRELQQVRQQAIGYGRYAPTHFTASADTLAYDEQQQPSGTKFTITHLDTEQEFFVPAVLGVQQSYVVAAAAAVAGQFDIALTDVARAVANSVPPPGRMRIVPGIKETVIIDDSYNSSPTAALQAVQTLQELSVAGRKVAVLGDMLELGRYSVPEHEKLGARVAAAADILVTLGVRSRKIAEAALEHGMSEKVILQYDDVERAGKEVQNLLQPGDVILVKASQAIRAERFVEEIMAEPTRAAELLPRQSKVWRERR